MAIDHPYGSVLPTMAISDVTIVAGWTAVAPSVLDSGLLCNQSWVSLLPPNTEQKKQKHNRGDGGKGQAIQLALYGTTGQSWGSHVGLRFWKKLTN